MFRLYRKSEFDLQKALPALNQTLAFRIKHRNQLTWSPIVPTVSQPIGSISSSSSTIRNRIISTASRTSAQSPRSSPDIDSPSLPNGYHTTRGGHNSIDVPQMIQTDSLIQLYPSSSKDPNNRPLVVVSIRHLDFDTDLSSSQPVPAPKTQALAAFERLRRYLARKAKSTDPGITVSRIPLQFILIIDLAGGRVSSTVRAFNNDTASTEILTVMIGSDRHGIWLDGWYVKQQTNSTACVLLSSW